MRRNTLKWLSDSIGKRKINIILLSLLQALLGGSGVLYALLLRDGIDSAVRGDRSGFTEALLFVIALVAAQILLRAAVRWLEEDSRSSIENRLKSKIFRTLLKKEYPYVSGVHSGEWMNRLTSDTKIVSDGAVDIFPGIAGMAVKMIGALSVLLVIEPKFFFVFFPCGAILLLLTYAFRKNLKRLHRSIQESDGRLRVFLQEHLGSLIVVKSFSAEQSSAEQGEVKMSEHKDARMRRIRFSNICNIGFSAFMSGMYIIGFAYCGIGIIGGTVSFGTLTAILQLISQMQSPLANISAYIPKFYAMTASAERLREAEDFPDDCAEEALDSRAVKDFYDNGFCAIKADNVCFKYGSGDAENVINDVSFTVKKGEKTAFTGHSGCGKSTFLKLLLCLYRCDGGSITLEREGGEGIPLTGKWHRMFAYVPQGNHLMNGTIRDIVTFSGKKSDDGDDAGIAHALRVACADGFVSELEHGIDTYVGERGAGLSEGQIQRIAIARAIYSDAPVLLLDESTSALDEATEKKLIENLGGMTDKTVILVTHRPGALKICDRIIEFTDDGTVRRDDEQGTL